MASTRRELSFGVPAGSALKDRQPHASHTAPRSAILVRLRPREQRIIEPDMLANVHAGSNCVDARPITAARHDLAAYLP